VNCNKQNNVFRRLISIFYFLITCYVALLSGCATHSTAMQMNDQGLHDWHDGRYDLAEENLQQALKQAQKDLGSTHFGIGIILSNQGLVYTDQGRYAEAIDVFQQADPILKRKYGNHNPTYAKSLNNYAYALLRNGSLKEAKEKYEQSLSTYKAAGTPEADTATVLNGLSIAYRDGGDLNQAESLANRAFRLVESNDRKWGIRGPILQNLGTIYMEQGFFDKAEDTYVQVLEVREKKLGTSHPNTGYTVWRLASLYQKEGKNEQAEEQFKRVIVIFERRLPEGHPDTKQLVGQYAEFLRSAGRSDEASELTQRHHAQ
jgi:tetratricopeptide (TPR) repeat protein